MPGASRAAKRKHLMASNAANWLGRYKTALCLLTALTCMQRGCGRGSLSTSPIQLVLPSNSACAAVLGLTAALHTAAEEAAIGVSGNTPHCYFPVNSQHTHFQPLNPEGLMMLKYCIQRYLRQCLLLDGNREGNKNCRCDCAQLCDWAIQHLHMPKIIHPETSQKQKGVPDPATARCI